MVEKKEKTSISVKKGVLGEVRKRHGNVSQICEEALIAWLSRFKDTSRESNRGETNHTSTKIIREEEQREDCQRAGGRLTGESLRKLRPSGRSAGPQGHGREIGVMEQKRHLPTRARMRRR